MPLLLGAHKDLLNVRLQEQKNEINEFSKHIWIQQNTYYTNTY